MATLACEEIKDIPTYYITTDCVTQRIGNVETNSAQTQQNNEYPKIRGRIQASAMNFYIFDAINLTRIVTRYQLPIWTQSEILNSR